jgi:hypothetical protein
MTEMKKLNFDIGQIKIEKKAIKISITPPIVPTNYKILKTYLL